MCLQSVILSSLQLTSPFLLFLAAGSNALAQDKDGVESETASAENSPLTSLETVTVQGSRLDEGAYTRSSLSTATGLPLSIRDTPQSTSVITRAQIEDQGTSEITEVISHAAGISSNTTTALGSDGVGFTSRGFAVDNYQIDGVQRPNRQYGFGVIPSDMASYESIEIVRGATGLLNGAGNPGAGINLIRKRPSKDFTAYLKGETGSWNRRRTEVDVGGALNENKSLRGRFVAAYQDNESFMDRMHMKKDAYYGILEADLSDATTVSLGSDYQRFSNLEAPRGGFSLFYNDGSKTDFDRSTNVGANWNDFYHSTLNIFAGVDHRFDNGWTVRFNAEYSKPEYDEIMGYFYGASSAYATANGIDPVTGSGGSVIAARWTGELEQHTLDFQAQGPYTLFGRKHDASFGVNYSLSTADGPNHPGWWSGEAYNVSIPNAFEFLKTGDVAQPDLGPSGGSSGGRVQQSGIYAATRMQATDALSVILGARVSRWQQKNWSKADGAKRVYTQAGKENAVPTPYAGLVFDLTEQVSVYASHTEIFNPQSQEDLQGDRLDPIRGVSQEFGLKLESADGRLNAGLAAFRIEQVNYGVAIEGGLTPKGAQAFRESKGVSSQGLEFEVAGEVLPEWQISSSFSRTLAEEKDKEILTNIPKNNFKLATAYKLLDNVRVGGNQRWQSDIYVVGGPTAKRYKQADFGVTDLMARYDWQDLSLQFNVNNVFDKKYYSSYFATSAFYGEPINYLLSASYAFKS